MSCAGCGADIAPAGTSQPVAGDPSRKARPQAFPFIPAAIAVVMVAGVYFWGSHVEHQKSEVRKQAEEARRKEFSAPVVGRGGVSVRQLAECVAEKAFERYEVRKVSRDGEILVLQLAVTEACGPLRAVQPHAELQGATVVVGWSWQRPPPNGVPTPACLCTRHLEFRIPGIPPGEPNVVIAENIPEMP